MAKEADILRDIDHRLEIVIVGLSKIIHLLEPPSPTIKAILTIGDPTMSDTFTVGQTGVDASVTFVNVADGSPATVTGATASFSSDNTGILAVTATDALDASVAFEAAGDSSVSAALTGALDPNGTVITDPAPVAVTVTPAVVAPTVTAVLTVGTPTATPVAATGTETPATQL